MGCIVIAHLNINSIGNKFVALKTMINGNIDIRLITETKLHESFPPPQFAIRGYKHLFRLDHIANGGGGIIFVRDDIQCKQMNTHKIIDNFECIFFEVKLRKQKLAFCRGLQSWKRKDFLNHLGTSLNLYIGKYDNKFLVGAFNSEVTEREMAEFCETYSLTNVIKEPTGLTNRNI